jgi:hypothetical protein
MPGYMKLVLWEFQLSFRQVGGREYYRRCSKQLSATLANAFDKSSGHPSSLGLCVYVPENGVENVNDSDI